MYRIDHKLYFLLLCVSLLITFIAAFIPVNCIWFTIFTGIGCGGIASVCIAWLIEIENCKKRNLMNQELIDKVFDFFDMSVLNEMSSIIAECHSRNEQIDLEKGYTLSEIADLIDKEDGYLPDWERHFCNIGIGFNTIDSSVLISNDPTSRHAKLYKNVRQGQNNHASYDYMKSFCEEIVPRDKNIGSVEYLLLKTEFPLIENIYKNRGLEHKYKGAVGDNMCFCYAE